MKGLSEKNINDFKKFINNIFCEIECFRYLEIDTESLYVNLYIEQDYLAIDRLLDNTIKQNILKNCNIVTDAGSNGLPTDFPAGKIEFKYAVYDVTTKKQIEDFFSRYA